MPDLCDMNDDCTMTKDQARDRLRRLAVLVRINGFTDATHTHTDPVGLAESWLRDASDGIWDLAWTGYWRTMSEAGWRTRERAAGLPDV